ncbi:Diphthamide biosynthesis protein 2 [Rhynchospora pubera]|uniref:2-(3-amino-3-carboxypropyl)histidine synthase subunit 2 n=1 Tax=Rhynchospora pubera TaxID=906938 RepID=A0AAV8C8E0_9POAL|nr:Diphthamide biosynthesis protein 2 [Rhynchospora pubera]
MDLENSYEVSRTVDFIRIRNYTKVVLQFPDELLKDSASVCKVLRRELGKSVRVYVMADTAYNSCCVDEIGASHVGAECVVHYGHACMSPTSNLPALFVFGKALLDVSACAEGLRAFLSTTEKTILVLYGLEYAHAIQDLQEALTEVTVSPNGNSNVQYAEVACLFIDPPENNNSKHEISDHGDDSKGLQYHFCKREDFSCKYHLGGLNWSIPADRKMEDYDICWIGNDNSAFANIVLTFNNSEIVRYDADENKMVKDVSHLKRVLKRRYFLVEKAKDANIVGILVGTLGVAGYLHIIQQLKELIEGAGKKSYTLVMGRPGSHKLANFPECEVFVYVSCAQTALLDSKDFLAPVITPFEAMLAFTKGRQWTGEYLLDFQDLISSTQPAVVTKQGNELEEEEEARFSFIKGGYVEDTATSQAENEEVDDSTSALVKATEKAMTLKSQDTDAVLYKGSAKSGSEYFSARSYQGLNPDYENPLPQSYVIGRKGRASGYKDEIEKPESDPAV